jgi:hypothetical protein
MCCRPASSHAPCAPRSRRPSTSGTRSCRAPAQAATRLGIPLPIDALSLDDATTCVLPVYVAILRQKDSRRVVVIDGGDGTLDEALSTVLTANLGYLTEALDAAAR